MSKVSVLIPVYNVEKYLEQCLESVTAQTEKDIEIICVEDASTDHSLEILERFQKKDSRIRLVCHEKNKGRCKTRKDAILSANGEYIMFLDSDDYIAPNACQELYQLIKKADADVAQFGTELLCGENVSKELSAWVRDFMEPSVDYIKGDLLRKCFVEGKINVNLVNKIWKRTCCQQAVEYITDETIAAAEDRYICFLFLYYACSYIGTKNKYYYYRLGVGVTGGDKLTLHQFEKRCSGAITIDKLKEFLEQVKSYGQYQDVYKCFADDILWDCADCWYRKLDRKDRPEGFRILQQFWNPGQITGALARTFFEQQAEIEACIEFPKVRKMAIYYRYVGYRAMDDIIKRYADYYTDRGYEAILITDSDAEEKDEQYMNCRLIHIPAATDANWDKYGERGRALGKELKGMSRLLYLSPTSHVMILDKIVAEAQGVLFQAAMDEYALDRINGQEEETRQRIEQLKNELCEEKLKYETAMKEAFQEKQRLEETIKHIYSTKCGKIMKFVQNMSYHLLQR